MLTDERTDERTNGRTDGRTGEEGGEGREGEGRGANPIHHMVMFALQHKMIYLYSLAMTSMQPIWGAEWVFYPPPVHHMLFLGR